MRCVNDMTGGSVCRLKGSILSMSFLDCNGALIPYSYEPWKDENRSGNNANDACRRDRKIQITFYIGFLPMILNIPSIE